MSTHRPPLLALWSFVFALGALAGLLWWRILDFDASIEAAHMALRRISEPLVTADVAETPQDDSHR